MHCERCEGLMVKDRYLDMEESGQLWLIAWRCANCGNVVDHKIQAHRNLRHAEARRRHSRVFPQQM